MSTKPKLVQKKTPNEIQGRDLFQTPSYATDLLIPFLQNMNIYNVWEPACGKGKIVNRLEYHKISCVGTDLSSDIPVNFLTENAYFNYSHIITNPPFSLKEKFYKRCLESGMPFALLIPFDFNGWLCEAFDKYDCQGLVPNRRINFITPSGKSEETGHTANFHSFWLTRFFNLPKQLTIVDLSLESKKNM